jgi:hypothetical protein
MPININGCGTAYYGRRDPRPDGSYITTEWVIVLCFPIIPLGSYRLLPTEGERWPLVDLQSYRAKRVPLCWPQVAKAYFLAMFAVALLTSAIWFLVWYFRR